MIRLFSIAAALAVAAMLLPVSPANKIAEVTSALDNDGWRGCASDWSPASC